MTAFDLSIYRTRASARICCEFRFKPDGDSDLKPDGYSETKPDTDSDLKPAT